MRKLSTLVLLFFLVAFGIPSAVFATNTYTTWDPANKGANVGLTGSNLIATKNNNAWQSVRSILGKSTGKWYWEVTLSGFGGAGESSIVGIGNASGLVSNDFTVDTNGWGLTGAGGSGSATDKRTNNSNTSFCSKTISNGDVIGVYMDVDAGSVGFIVNDGTDCGNAFTGLAATTYYAYVAQYSNGANATANFGASAFSHSVPSGYNAGLYSASSNTSLVLMDSF